MSIKNKFAKEPQFGLLVSELTQPKNRELKKWNGRGHGQYERKSICVAAYSIKQAAELVSLACYGRTDMIGSSEIKVYYSGCWGNPMEGITPDRPCVYVGEGVSRDQPTKII